MLPLDPVIGVDDAALDDEVVEEMVEGIVAVTDVVVTGTISCAAADVGWPQVWPELYVICTVANCRGWC